MSNNLSVAIITHNEERNISLCLESVKQLADEIVVIDSYSTDRTEEICLQYGVTFIKNRFPGHIEQKNIAKEACSHTLVLSLDADEVLSLELQRSVQAIKDLDVVMDGYLFSRLTFYAGVPVRHCGWYPDKSLRLWNRTKGRWGGSNPHDRFFMDAGATIG